jgi:ribosome-associated protein
VLNPICIIEIITLLGYDFKKDKSRVSMKFELQDEYIELFKLIKVLDLVDSGAQAKYIVADGHVKRNGEVEVRKRAKIVAGDVIEIEDVRIEVVAS